MGLIEARARLLQACRILMDTVLGLLRRVLGPPRLLEACRVLMDTVLWLLRRVLRRRRSGYRLGLMLHCDGVLGRLGDFGVGARSGGAGIRGGAARGPDEVGDDGEGDEEEDAGSGGCVR